MKNEITLVKVELKNEIALTKNELKSDIALVKGELKKDIDLTNKDLTWIKWLFGFLGSIVTILLSVLLTVTFKLLGN